MRKQVANAGGATARKRGPPCGREEPCERGSFRARELARWLCCVKCATIRRLETSGRQSAPRMSRTISWTSCRKKIKKSGVQFRGVNVYSGVAAQPGRQWLSRSCTTLIGSRFLSSVRKRKDLKFTTSSRNVKNKVAYDVICPVLERLVASEAFWWMSRCNGSCPLALLTWEADS